MHIFSKVYQFRNVFEITNIAALEVLSIKACLESALEACTCWGKGGGGQMQFYEHLLKTGTLYIVYLQTVWKERTGFLGSLYEYKV